MNCIVVDNSGPNLSLWPFWFGFYSSAPLEVRRVFYFPVNWCDFRINLFNFTIVLKLFLGLKKKVWSVFSTVLINSKHRDAVYSSCTTCLQLQSSVYMLSSAVVWGCLSLWVYIKALLITWTDVVEVNFHCAICLSCNF